MKIYLTIFIAVLSFIGCGSDDDNENCTCNKENWDIEQSVETGSNGLPHLVFEHVLLNEETVVCQDEGEFTTTDNLYYKIICD